MANHIRALLSHHLLRIGPALIDCGQDSVLRRILEAHTALPEDACDNEWTRPRSCSSVADWSRISKNSRFALSKHRSNSSRTSSTVKSSSFTGGVWYALAAMHIPCEGFHNAVIHKGMAFFRWSNAWWVIWRSRGSAVQFPTPCRNCCTSNWPDR